MNGSITLSDHQYKVLLQLSRTAATHEQRLRAHILVLLARGWTWTVIAAVLFTSSSTINRWRRRFLQGGLAAVTGPSPRGRASWFSRIWVKVVLRWVTTLSPQDFGFHRSRWSCATIVILLHDDYQVQVSAETVRRWLRQGGLVYRRPRPVPGPKDPDRSVKLRKIRTLLRDLPADETAVFQDEVDVNTNPEIGSMWMPKGQQATVITPGTNVKRYLAGSMNWRTGEMILTQGTKRNADLFVTHLDELRRRYRRYRVIHVICDNAGFHTPARCRRVAEYLRRWGHRVKLHYLPTYSPQTNPIERVWWHLREQITRNHRCSNIEELVEQVMQWFEATKRFQIETSLYQTKKAA